VGYLVWGLAPWGVCCRFIVEGASRCLFRVLPASSEEREAQHFRTQPWEKKPPFTSNPIPTKGPTLPLPSLALLWEQY
jgi:hypothetical protein